MFWWEREQKNYPGLETRMDGFLGYVFIYCHSVKKQFVWIWSLEWIEKRGLDSISYQNFIQSLFWTLHLVIYQYILRLGGLFFHQF